MLKRKTNKNRKGILKRENYMLILLTQSLFIYLCVCVWVCYNFFLTFQHSVFSLSNMKLYFIFSVSFLSYLFIPIPKCYNCLVSIWFSFLNSHQRSANLDQHSNLQHKYLKPDLQSIQLIHISVFNFVCNIVPRISLFCCSS